MQALVPSAAGHLRPGDEEGNWKELIEQEVQVALQKQKSVADDIDSLLKTTKWKAFKATWAKKQVRHPAAIPRSAMATAVWLAVLKVPQLGLIMKWEAVAYAAARLHCTTWKYIVSAAVCSPWKYDVSAAVSSGGKSAILLSD